MTKDIRDNGELCSFCKKRYLTVWRCSDKLWEKIEGIISKALICPECFDRIMREKGINLYWECAEEEFPIEKSAKQNKN